MGWTKLGTLAFLLVIIFTVSVFGGHFGYTVDGVPQGSSYYTDEGGDWEEGRYMSDTLITGYWSEVFEDTAIGELGSAMGFLFHLTTFQVDGVPELISVIFVIMSLLSLFIIVSMFLPGGSG